MLRLLRRLVGVLCASGLILGVTVGVAAPAQAQDEDFVIGRYGFFHLGQLEHLRRAVTAIADRAHQIGITRDSRRRFALRGVADDQGENRKRSGKYDQYAARYPVTKFHSAILQRRAGQSTASACRPGSELPGGWLA